MPLAIAFVDGDGKICVGSTTDGKDWKTISNGHAGVDQTPYSSTVTPGLARGSGKEPRPEFAVSYTTKNGNVEIGPWGETLGLEAWLAGKAAVGATPALLNLQGDEGYPPLLVAFPAPPPLVSVLLGSSQSVVGSTAWPADSFYSLPSVEQYTISSPSLAIFPFPKPGSIRVISTGISSFGSRTSAARKSFRSGGPHR